MKVLFYYYFGAGGGLSNIEMLLCTLVREFPGDEYHVVCAASSPLSAIGDAERIKVTLIKSSAGKEALRLVTGLWGLRNAVAQSRADVLWSMNSGSYLPVGVPQVLSVHNARQVYPLSEVCSSPSDCARLPLLRWFFRRTLAHSDGVIVQTDLMKRYVSEIKQASSRIAVIPKSVETSHDARLDPLPEQVVHALDRRADGFAFTFVYAANMRPAKNHLTLLLAMQRLRAMNVRARLVLTVTEAELLSLAAEASSLIEGGYIIPIGNIARQHVRSLYEACNGCVMPSLLESQSSAHLEAMRWGKPQISADLAYARDLCGGASLYAVPRDPDDWARKMRDLASDSITRGRLTEAGRRRMRMFPQTWSQAARMVRAFLAETVARVR